VIQRDNEQRGRWHGVAFGRIASQAPSFLMEMSMQTPGNVKRVFVDSVKRLNLCIENNVGHIEQVLYIKAFVLPYFFL
jgi:hypothetical protein